MKWERCEECKIRKANTFYKTRNICEVCYYRLKMKSKEQAYKLKQHKRKR